MQRSTNVLRFVHKLPPEGLAKNHSLVNCNLHSLSAHGFQFAFAIWLSDGFMALWSRWHLADPIPVPVRIQIRIRVRIRNWIPIPMPPTPWNSTSWQISFTFVCHFTSVCCCHRNIVVCGLLLIAPFCSLLFVIYYFLVFNANCIIYCSSCFDLSAHRFLFA